MMRRTLLGALLVALAAAPFVGADSRNHKKSTVPPVTGVEKKDTGATLPGAAVEKKVAKLTDQVHWFASLDEARAEARKQHKPIFWLHALGDLDGDC